MERKSLAWQQQSSPLKKKYNVQKFVGKAMVGVFRVSEEHLLVEFFETDAIFIVEPHVRAFKNLQQRIRNFRPSR